MMDASTMQRNQSNRSVAPLPPGADKQQGAVPCPPAHLSSPSSVATDVSLGSDSCHELDGHDGHNGTNGSNGHNGTIEQKGDGIDVFMEAPMIAPRYSPLSKFMKRKKPLAATGPASSLDSTLDSSSWHHTDTAVTQPLVQTGKFGRMQRRGSCSNIVRTSSRGGRRSLNRSHSSSQSRSGSRSTSHSRSRQVRTTRKRVRFDAAVRAKFTLHVNNYTEEEKKQSWYSMEDIAEIRGQARSSVHRMQADPHAERDRGLECRTKQGLQRRNRNKAIARTAVLDEQRAQKSEGVFFPDTIARVYKTQTQPCMTEAWELGRADHKAALAVRKEDRDDDAIFALFTSAPPLSSSTHKPTPKVRGILVTASADQTAAFHIEGVDASNVVTTSRVLDEVMQTITHTNASASEGSHHQHHQQQSGLPSVESFSSTISSPGIKRRFQRGARGMSPFSSMRKALSEQKHHQHHGNQNHTFNNGATSKGLSPCGGKSKKRFSMSALRDLTADSLHSSTNRIDGKASRKNSISTASTSSSSASSLLSLLAITKKTNREKSKRKNRATAA